MTKEDQIINEYLNPVLLDLMQQSLDSIIEMKEQDLIKKEDVETIEFIKEFIDESFDYYSSTNNLKNCAILSDLKQYLFKITG